MSDHFASEQLRVDLTTRAAQSNLMLDVNDPRCAFAPDHVGEYHTLFPLDAVVDDPDVGSLGCVSRVYKALSRFDGGTYALRKLDNVKINADHNAMRKVWGELVHPNLVRLRNIFITNEFDGHSNSLTFVHDFVFGAMTLTERHSRVTDQVGDISEDLIWSYIAQISSALRFLHSRGKAMRCLQASKVLVTPQHRVLLNASAVLDVIGDRKAQMENLQAEDLRAFGNLLVQTVCRSPESSQPQALSSSIDYIGAHYHPDLKDLIVFLISQPGGPQQATIFAACARISGRLLEQLDYTYHHIDTCHSELAKEIQNGRLFRLLGKINTILERPERNTPAATSWSETGDRYLIKLFMDYVFHQRDDQDRPVIEFGFIVQCLNKLDVGVSEKMMLMSPDEQTVLVVSFGDLKACIERSFNELMVAASVVAQTGASGQRSFANAPMPYSNMDYGDGGGMQMGPEAGWKMGPEAGWSGPSTPPRPVSRSISLPLSAAGDSFNPSSAPAFTPL
mmetsp:Transcript_56875/g.135705  ORF Transcript_56875/g.135705 Transcript_56875/m.135705 type:complete len:506 (+) Transcript_56875:3-1520(+)